MAPQGPWVIAPLHMQQPSQNVGEGRGRLDLGLWAQRSGVKEVKARSKQKHWEPVAEMLKLGLEKRGVKAPEVKEQGSWE